MISSEDLLTQPNRAEIKECVRQTLDLLRSTDSSVWSSICESAEALNHISLMGGNSEVTYLDGLILAALMHSSANQVDSQEINPFSTSSPIADAIREYAGSSGFRIEVDVDDRTTLIDLLEDFIAEIDEMDKLGAK